jgi:hypothetical protein
MKRNSKRNLEPRNLSGGIFVAPSAVFSDAIEDAVDETAAFFSAESFRKFDSLVQTDGSRDVRTTRQFVGAEPEYVSVDPGHSFDTPIGARRTNELIDASEARDDPSYELVGESPTFGVAWGFAPVVANDVIDVAFGSVDGEEHL